MKVGYIRVRNQGAGLTEQEVMMAELGVSKVFIDSGSGVSDKPRLQALIDSVSSGDVVVVHSLDRFSRDMAEVQSILETFKQKGVTVEPREF